MSKRKSDKSFVRISPKRTPGQLDLWDALRSSVQEVCVSGPPGTGKSFLSTFWAVREIMRGNYDKLVITRSVKAIQDEDTGHVKGSEADKMAPWMVPLTENLKKFGFESNPSNFEMAPLGKMRGRSFENTVIICDEAQNVGYDAFKSLTTRYSDDSKLILCGDFKQFDGYSNKCVFEYHCEQFHESPWCTWVETTFEDCCRSKHMKAKCEGYDEIKRKIKYDKEMARSSRVPRDKGFTDTW